MAILEAVAMEKKLVAMIHKNKYMYFVANFNTIPMTHQSFSYVE